MKCLFSLVVAVVASGAVCAEDPIKIGILVPLTGESTGAWGQQVQEAVQLAQAKRPNPRVEFVFEDSQCQIKTAMSAARKLVSVDKVKLIIGDLCWTDLVAQVTEPARVVVISPGSAQSTVRDAGDFVFRLKLDVSVDSRAMAQTLLQKTAYRKVAMVYVQDQWGEGIARNFSEEFEKRGGKVEKVGYSAGTTDFKSLLLKLKEKRPELIMLGAYPSEIGILARQARTMGMRQPFAAYRGGLSDETLKLGGAALDGLLYLEEFNVDSPVEPTAGFVREFKERYKRNPNLFGAMSYDAYNLFLDAIAECTVDTQCIRDYLYQVHDYAGVSGSLTFDDHGDVKKELKLRKIQDSAFVDY